jgi:hypothetical protein
MKHIITIIAVLFAFTINAQIDYNNTTINGTLASAIGESNTAEGSYSFAGGANSIGQNIYSFAFGNTALSLGNHAVALGLSTTSNGNSAFTLGKYITADNNNSFVLGTGLGSSMKLINPNENSLMIGFNSEKPTFYIEGGDNPFVSGKVAIGDLISPQAKLHIKADDGEAADILLETSEDELARISFGTQGNSIEALASESMKFSSPSNFLFTDGYLGIKSNDFALAAIQIGADWTFIDNMPREKVIAYNAYFKGDSLKRIVNGYSSSIRFSNEGEIFIGTDVNEQGETLITYDDAIIVKEGMLGIKKQPNYPLDVNGISRTDSLLATFYITSPIINSNYIQADTVSSSYVIADSIRTDNFYVDGTLYVDSIYYLGNLIYENLSIDKVLTCEELVILPSKWKDEVFEEDYNLLSINEMDMFIQKNHHLPNFPKEEIVLNEGMDVGDYYTRLLQTTEEQMLYIIDLTRENQEMKVKMNKMELALEQLKAERGINK